MSPAHKAAGPEQSTRVGPRITKDWNTQKSVSPCTTKLRKLQLLHAFYATQRRLRRTAKACTPAPQHPHLWQHCQKQQQQQHHQKEHCGDQHYKKQQPRKQQHRTQLHQGQKWWEKRRSQQARQHRYSVQGKDDMVQGSQTLQFFSVPSLAHEPAYRKQAKKHLQNVKEGDTGDEEEEKEKSYSHYVGSSSNASPIRECAEKPQQKESVKALRKVEAELKQATNVVHQIESTLLLPEDNFQKMQILTQQNISLSSRLCLLRAKYRRVKHEKQELEARRIAEIDYVKFQEAMQHRIKQLEQQLRADAGAKNTRHAARKGMLAVHGAQEERGQLENLKIQHTLEIRTLKDLAALDMERVRQAQEREISQLQQALQAAREDMRVELKKRQHVSRLQQEATIEQLRCSWETKFQELRQQHERQLLQQKRLQEEALHRADLAHEAAVVGEKQAFAKKLQQREKHWETRLLDQEAQIVKERDNLIARFRERLHRLEEELEQQRREAARLYENFQQQQLHWDRSSAELERQLREAMLEKTELQGEISRQGEELEELRRKLCATARVRGVVVSANNAFCPPGRALQADRSCQVSPPVRSRGTQVEDTMLEYLQECADIAADAEAAMNEELSKAKRHDVIAVAHATIEQEHTGEGEAAAVVDAHTAAAARVAQRMQQTEGAIQRLQGSAYILSIPAAAERQRKAAPGVNRETWVTRTEAVTPLAIDLDAKPMNLDHHSKPSIRRNSFDSQSQWLEQRRQHAPGAAAGDVDMWTQAQQMVSPYAKRFAGEAQFLRAPSTATASLTKDKQSKGGHTEREKEKQLHSLLRSGSLVRGFSPVPSTTNENRSREQGKYLARTLFSLVEKNIEEARYTPSLSREDNSRGQDPIWLSRWQAKSAPLSPGLPVGKRNEVKPASLSIWERTDAATLRDGNVLDWSFGVDVGEKTLSRKGSTLWKPWTDSKGEAEEATRSTEERFYKEAQRDTVRREEREGGEGTIVDKSEVSDVRAGEEEGNTRSRELFQRLADVAFRARMPAHVLTRRKHYFAKERSDISDNISLRLSLGTAEVLHKRLDAANAAGGGCASATAGPLRAAYPGSEARTGVSLVTVDTTLVDACGAESEVDSIWSRRRNSNHSDSSDARIIPLALQRHLRTSDADTFGSRPPLWNARSKSGNVPLLQEKQEKCLINKAFSSPLRRAPCNSSSGTTGVPAKISSSSPLCASTEPTQASSMSSATVHRPLPADAGRSTAKAAECVSPPSAAPRASAQRVPAVNKPNSCLVLLRENNLSTYCTSTPGTLSATILTGEKKGTEKIFEGTPTSETPALRPKREGGNHGRRVTEPDKACFNGDLPYAPPISSTQQKDRAEETQHISVRKKLIMGISSSLDLQSRSQARFGNSTVSHILQACSAHAPRKIAAAPEEAATAAAEGEEEKALPSIRLEEATARRGTGCDKVTADTPALAVRRAEAHTVRSLMGGREAEAPQDTIAASRRSRREDLRWGHSTLPALNTLQVRLENKQLRQQLQNFSRAVGGDGEDTRKRKVFPGKEIHQRACGGSSSHQRAQDQGRRKASRAKPCASLETGYPKHEN